MSELDKLLEEYYEAAFNAGYKEAEFVIGNGKPSNNIDVSTAIYDAIKQCAGEKVMSEYRNLQYGEEIKIGDEVDGCRDGWRDAAEWEPVPEHMIGRRASDPAFPSHSKYRRKIIND